MNSSAIKSDYKDIDDYSSLREEYMVRSVYEDQDHDSDENIITGRYSSLEEAQNVLYDEAKRILESDNFTIPSNYPWVTLHEKFHSLRRSIKLYDAIKYEEDYKINHRILPTMYINGWKSDWANGKYQLTIEHNFIYV